MADVFFSYQHMDRARIQPIVRLLEAAGLTIWWDQSLLAGDRFSMIISRELHVASCVIVAWSASSVRSTWVCDEATSGRERGILVPISLDGTVPPLGFGQQQTPNLSEWTGDEHDPRIRQLVAGVAHIVGKRMVSPEPPPPRAAPPPWRRRSLLIGMFALMAAIVAVALFIVSWPTPAYQVGRISLPSNATNIVLSSGGNVGYVVHSSAGAISMIDMATRTVVRTISGVGTGALAMAIAPDGRTGYVSHYSSPYVSVVDLTTGTRVTDIDVGGPQWEIRLGPDGHRAYVANRGTGMLSVIDTGRNAIVGRILTSIDSFDSPVSLALTLDGRRAYVTNRGSGTVAVVNTAQNTVTATIRVQQAPNGVAVSPNGSIVYITNEGSNTLSVIDLAENAVTKTIVTDSAPIAVAFTPDGKRALVVNRGSLTVAVIDTSTGERIATASLAHDPGSIAVAPDGRTAYVTGGDSNMLFTVTL
jgi:YVTN family beta-propeller protein